MTTAGRRGRPTRHEAEAIEERLRRAALDAFVARGFDGTTMEAVAAAAGVTKRTLYARYPDKRSLFAAVVPWALARMPFGEADDVAAPSDADDLGTALRALGRSVVARLVDPESVRLRRLAVLEAGRFPEFAEAANATLWRQSVESVVRLLAAHARVGTVILDDVELVADQFIAMVAGEPTILADLGIVRPADEEGRRIDHAVELVLGGILPRPP